jgi:hypothetical protein
MSELLNWTTWKLLGTALLGIGVLIYAAVESWQRFQRWRNGDAGDEVGAERAFGSKSTS